MTELVAIRSCKIIWLEEELDKVQRYLSIERSACTMSWLGMNLTGSLSNVTGQISNFTRKMLTEETKNLSGMLKVFTM